MKKLTPKQEAQTKKNLESMEARLFALLDRKQDELRLTVQILPLAYRIRLLLFVAVLIIACRHKHLTDAQRQEWIRQEMDSVQAGGPPALPMERHRRLLQTLVIRGCVKRGEFVPVRQQQEERLREEEAEYRRRFGDEAYHRMILQGDKTTQEQPEQEAA